MAKKGKELTLEEKLEQALVPAEEQPYEVPEGNNQIFAAKYMPYLPTEEELKRELNLDDFKKMDEK